MGRWPFGRRSDAAPEPTPEVAAGPRGWWFASGPTSRGEVNTFDGEPVPGRAGLHAATGPLAALPYAKSERLCHVQLGGTVAEVDGQLAATWRRVLFIVDANDALRPLVAASIERLTGGALETREAHLEHAGESRERVLASADRVRDARWVLEEGAGARGGDARALAEGALAGAQLAAAEARARAEAHEAAAALLEGGSIQHLARAVDHLVAARAAFEKGDAHDAALRARERLDAELSEALLALEPEEALPPVVVAASEVAESVAEVEAAAPSMPSPPSSPSQPVRVPLFPLPAKDPGSVHAPDPFASPPCDVMVLSAPDPRAIPPSPSAAQVLERLGAILAAEPFVVRHVWFRTHRLSFIQSAPNAGVVVQLASADLDAAAEIVESLDQDPVLASAGLVFAATWDAETGPWLATGRRLPDGSKRRPHTVRLAAHIMSALDGPEVFVDPLRLELLMCRGVRAAAWSTASAQPVLVLDCDRAAMPEALARLRRCDVTRVLAGERGSDTLYTTEGVMDWSNRDRDFARMFGAALLRPFFIRDEFFEQARGLALATAPPDRSMAVRDVAVATAPIDAVRLRLAHVEGARLHYMRTAGRLPFDFVGLAVHVPPTSRVAVAHLLASSRELASWGLSFVVASGPNEEPIVVTPPDGHGGSNERQLRDAATEALQGPALGSTDGSLRGDVLRFCLHVVGRWLPGAPRVRLLDEPPSLVATVAEQSHLHGAERELQRLFPSLAWLVVGHREDGAPKVIGAPDHELHGWTPARLAEAADASRGAALPGATPRAKPDPLKVPPPIWNERPSKPSRPVSPWTNALATKIERTLAVPDGAHCPRCETAYVLPPGTPLAKTRCGLCDHRGLVGGVTAPAGPGAQRRVRCPSCSSSFKVRVGFTHARCTACSVAVVPLPLADE